MKKYYVYVLLRPWNNIPCYVGKGTEGRVLVHEYLGDKHYNKHLANVLRKAAGNLRFIFLWVGDNEDEAHFWECFFIRWYGRKDRSRGPLCNLTDGGDGHSGYKHTEEWKSANSARMMGNTNTLGHKQSLESRRKKSLALKGRKLSAEQCQKLKGQKRSLGYKHTEEWKATAAARMMGNTHSLGYKFTAEQSATLSRARTGNTNAKGSKWSPEARKNHAEAVERRRALQKK